MSQHTSSASGGSLGGNPIGIKETITSLLIAFMLAFTFRGFVVEGFQIPTGSMAPTLLGKNLRFQSPSSGYNWTTGPWEYVDRTRTVPAPVQGRDVSVVVNDPMTGAEISAINEKLSSGDRVFVLKYLPWLHHAERWDVVVFKNPGTHQNYIKRLVGLPGEQVLIVDGDIFTREFVEGETAGSGWDAWAQDDWSIARKSERVQRAMLQPIHDSRFAPVVFDPGYRSPWDSSGSGWEGVKEAGVFTYTGSGATGLEWNGVIPLSERNAYNQIHPTHDPRYTAGRPSMDPRYNYAAYWAKDLAVSADFRLDSDGVTLSPEIEVRGRAVRAVVETGTGAVRLEMRERTEGSDEDRPWTVVDSAQIGARESGDTVSVELWHMDEALWLFIDGKLVCGGAEKGAYSESPMETVLSATGLTRAELIERSEGYPGDGVSRPGVLADPTIYRGSSVGWSMSGGGFTMHNVRVARDIHYRTMPDIRATRGGHPDFFPTLTGEEYFMCGDNSARSEDSRLWRDGDIYPWVAAEIDDRPGVVHEDLIVGKAFVVYWPSLRWKGSVPVPDVGRVRWIF